jgi:shikimate kinase
VAPTELPDRIALVGFMGSGKSAVGRALARAVLYEFVDLDAVIAARCGRTIPAIFREEGEGQFRLAELEAAREAVTRTRIVLATGGGAFAQPRTREVLQSTCTTVWLRVALATVLKRVPEDGSRPLAGNREIMGTLLKSREPSYSEADLTVDSDDGTPAQVAKRILRVLRKNMAVR